MKSVLLLKITEHQESVYLCVGANPNVNEINYFSIFRKREAGRPCNTNTKEGKLIDNRKREDIEIKS